MLESLNQAIAVADDTLGVFAVHGDAVSITVNRHAPWAAQTLDAPEIRLRPGKGLERGKLVGDGKGKNGGKFVGVLSVIDGEEHFVIDNARQAAASACPPPAWARSSGNFCGNTWRPITARLGRRRRKRRRSAHATGAGMISRQSGL